MDTYNNDSLREEDLDKDSDQAFREVENNELETAHTVEELWKKLDEDEGEVNI